MLFEAFGFIYNRSSASQVRSYYEMWPVHTLFVHQAGTLFDVGNISILLFDVLDIDKVMTLLHNE